MCVGVMCLVLALLCSSQCPFQFCNHRVNVERACPEVLKLVSFSTQLSTKFILLINVLSLISMIHAESERLKTSQFFICRYYSFYQQLKFRTQLS